MNKILFVHLIIKHKDMATNYKNWMIERTTSNIIPSPGAYRAYFIDDPEHVVAASTCAEVVEEIEMAIEDRKVRRELRKSVEIEETKKHFINLMKTMEVLLNDNVNLRNVDTVEEYIQAARHANTLGLNCATHELENWLYNELQK